MSARLTGTYDIPAAHVAVLAVMANTNGTAPYRGAGRPEATYVIERLIDDAARELGFDPVELRTKNLIPASAMPYKTALNLNYDCGDFPANQQKALAQADWAGFPARRDEAKSRGKLRGIGIANPIEKAAGPGQEFAEIRFHPSGNATLLDGQQEPGPRPRDHLQASAERKARARSGDRAIHRRRHRPRRLRHRHQRLALDGDRRLGLVDGGRQGHRQGQTHCRASARSRRARHRIRRRSDGGNFSVAGTDRRVSITDVAKASFQSGRLPPGLEGGLYETGTFAPDDNTYPNGCHVCEVEIDPDTGALEIVRYVVVDDVGTVVNPIGLKGQIHGGVAQGLGQALMEQVVYDRQSGQNLTGSFMDYCMPRADTMPYMEITSNPVPTKRNPLGAKGAGEAGTVGALPAIVNAVIDALAPLGVKGLDMPATSERIWQAMRDARA